MSLLSNLREKRKEKVATAIPAIFATDGRGSGAIVARIATVAVANPKEEKTAPPAKVGAGDTATAYRWWLIHYPDRDSMEMACCPEATHAEILERHPDAVAAEPFTPTIRQPSIPLTASEEMAIRAWLALIEESDPATIAEVIGQCQRDADARDYFTGRAAAELPKSDSFLDDRRTCGRCANLRASVCIVASPTSIVIAARGYRPSALNRETPHLCAGFNSGIRDGNEG
jgi:hypothetical protein